MELNNGTAFNKALNERLDKMIESGRKLNLSPENRAIANSEYKLGVQVGKLTQEISIGDYCSIYCIFPKSFLAGFDSQC